MREKRFRHDLVMNMLAGIDPDVTVKYCIELAEKYLEENDAVQASEKLYKAAEECIKALAGLHKTPEYERVLKAGRWKTGLLNSAVVMLAKSLNEPIIVSSWDAACYLRVQGFHEARPYS